MDLLFNGLLAERYLIAGGLAGLLSISAYVPYIRDTLAGRTRPDRACWLIWAVLAMISGASNIYEGAGTSLGFVAIQVLGTLVVFGLSVRLGAGGYLCRKNMVTLAAAGVGLASWAVMDTAVYALALSIGISALGGLRTIAKSYADPGTESKSTWWLMVMASALGVYSVGAFDPMLLAYPLYLLCLYGAIVVAMAFGRAHQTRDAAEVARAVRRLTTPPITRPVAFQGSFARSPQTAVAKPDQLAA